jgi:hypothetical protein
MSLYLYLNEHSYANTWINGGVAPINPASYYKSTDRSGIYTPDENLIHKSEFDLKNLGPGVQVGNAYGLTLQNVVVEGVRIPDVRDAYYFEDDGLILSFSYRLTRTVARKMKKKSCVKIIDIKRLKEDLDEQLGVESKAGPCRYTSGHQRNHFLKSNLDEWQAEYRLFWPVKSRAEVSIPQGTAELICTW